MILPIFTFELKNLLRSWPIHFIFLLFFLSGLIIFGIRGTGVTAGQEWANSSLALYRIISLMNLFNIIIVATYMGKSVQKDFHLNTYPLIFTKPISKTGYLGGRFLGAFAAMVFVSSGVGVGAFVASWMPYVDPEHFGAQSWQAYLRPYLFAVVPNLFITASIFFALAVLTKRMMPVYAGSVLVFSIYGVASDWVETLDSLSLASILDPFAYSAELAITRYWTVVEKNTLLLPFSRDLLLNRLLWCGVGLVALVLACRRFSLSHVELRKRERSASIPSSKSVADVNSMPATATFGRGFTFRALSASARMELKTIVKSVSFWVIALSAVLFVLGASVELGSYLGTRTYPVTYAVIELLGVFFDLFVFITIIFYTGELVWRERDARMSQIHDSLPLPSWLPFASKLLALLAVQLLLMLILLITCVSIQLGHEYTRLQLGQYLVNFFFLRMAIYLPLWVFGIFLHTVINKKALAHLAMILSFFLIGPLDNMGFDHNLYRLFRVPRLVFSDMNGYGPTLAPYLWFALYWCCLALVLAVLTHLLWVRGSETTLRHRWGNARLAFGKAPGFLLFGGLAAFITVGGLIFYNTNVLNDYLRGGQRYRERAAYETTYRTFRDLLQPRVTAVDALVEIYPEARTARCRGTYRLVNTFDEPMDHVFVNFSWHLVANMFTGGGVQPVEVHGVDLDRPHVIEDRNRELGTYLFKLEHPLLKGDPVELVFDVELKYRGFPNRVYSPYIVENRTFIESVFLFPTLGYNSWVEVANPRRRTRLGPGSTSPPMDDPAALKNTLLQQGFDLTHFDLVIGTSGDQIAVGPGTLKREWESGGRKYFHYGLDQPMLLDFACISGRYAVQRDTWDGVAIEIYYYHRRHTYNIKRMLRAVKDALNYYTESFGPYQFDVLRVVEFPRYQSYAEALPGLVSSSEALGFIADVDPDDPDGVDYPYKIMAHEVAHQWWAHQVIPANVQGSMVVTESLANYSAFAVMERSLGEAVVRRYLRVMLDEYLTGRSRDKGGEVTLALTNPSKTYLHYYKGLLAMWALRDYIGEEAVNRALAAFLQAKRYQEPPFTTSRELKGYLLSETPDHLHYLLEDYFEEIIFYDFEAVHAEARPIGTGYEVTFAFRACKRSANGMGKETEVPLRDWVEIAVLDENGTSLYEEKHLVDRKEMTVTVQVDGRPVTAGVDPFNLLIDRIPDNNRTEVYISIQEG